MQRIRVQRHEVFENPEKEQWKTPAAECGKCRQLE
jgi:hypothetical protein